jgi:hypothetical protein
MFSRQKNANGVWYGAYHPILMVKDYNERKELTIDNDLMTNADVPSIVLSTIKQKDNQKPHDTRDNEFRLYTKKGNLTVKDNIFELNNWKYQP